MAEEEIEIILRAIDDASNTFEAVSSSAEDIGNSIDSITSSGLDDVANSADNAGAGMSSADGDAQGLANSIDNIETEANESKEALDGMADLMAFQEISSWVNQAADAMWQLADKAGTVQDSWTRVGLAAEGAGIPVDNMKKSIGDLSAETGRAGGSVRESFIAMSSAGVTELSAMESAFKGASAQSFILGTDVDALVNKFSGMAMKSSVAERTLKGTGITVEELGNALGIQGATIEDVNAKWETMDTNARMAALGQASAMNEGKDANDAFKNSWEGLQAQIDIAKGRLEVLVGNVLLPVLVPALEAAARVLDWFGNMFSAVMDGPLGTFISIIGSVGAGLILLLGGITAVTAGMGFFTASLWPAITASWALLAPWLPFIAAAVAIVVAIYEIGKAFGWWSDASSMMDAIWDGIQRLWDAFINHPDVQALIQGITDAWNWLVPAVTGVVNAIMEFFGITTGGKFDIVHALIMAIGQAWNFITAPIRAVISAVQNVIGAFDQFRNGQMDLPTFIMTILQNLLNVYMSIFGRIIVLVVQWGSRIFSSAVRAVTRFVTGIVTRVRQLPGRVYSALMGVVGRITSAIQSWINAAKSKVQSLISSITSPFSGVASRISGALSGVANAITKPFRDAWNMVKPWVDKIKQGLDMIGNIAFGGESAYGGEALDSNGQAFNVSNGQYIVEADNSPIEINDNINLTLDLRNVPSNVNTGQLIEALGDKRVLSALTSNRDFQDLDAKVKQKIALKNVRSRGR
jgi:phage-related protein